MFTRGVLVVVLFVLVVAVCGCVVGGCGGAREGGRSGGGVVSVVRALRWFDASLTYLGVFAGRQVGGGSVDKTVRVWDAVTGKEVQKLEGHSDVVTSVLFSPVRVCRSRGRGSCGLWWARSVWHVCDCVGVLGTGGCGVVLLFGRGLRGRVYA